MVSVLLYNITTLLSFKLARLRCQSLDRSSAPTSITGASSLPRSSAVTCSGEPFSLRTMVPSRRRASLPPRSHVTIAATACSRDSGCKYEAGAATVAGYRRQPFLFGPGMTNNRDC